MTAQANLEQRMADMDRRLTEQISKVGTSLEVHVAQCTASHIAMTATIDRLARTVAIGMGLLALLAIGLKTEFAAKAMALLGLL
jgi:predicted metalloenzyme YecM